ncbi:NADH-quinone oxidoreductase subunit J family protein [Hippea maritima]|uniref:NADH-quinone oxidoreductase subunit J n=1 Tax=Hippea maritima (strain ATCC 700847 / DSM 10411 / MH2) TaxID=760142 RepID=F2LXN0_HIPMA|nr:NADH-quinone oxidoreductase subunit J [Hippea maritima]AEA33216.1 NADH-ubiquinone/plastoquinone oxidoreductase chain 6 [Hippea maritima DSM 10411]
MEAIVFYIIAILTVGGALGVLLSKNPYRAALFMVLAFFGIAGLFVMLHAQFNAMLQLIVYAGAIAVMITLTMMVMNRRTLEGLKRFNSQWYWAAFIGIGLLADLIALAYKFKIDLSNAGKNLALGGSNTKLIGEVLFKHYLLPFEITAIILLVALLGAVVLTKRDIK